MNLEAFPDCIKKDIEDQSLSILASISEDIIVIGGWAVRALTGDTHGRYTLDIDGVTDLTTMDSISSQLAAHGMKPRKHAWGLQFFHSYVPHVEISDDLREALKNVELRIELSAPRIYEARTHHFFEFSLTHFEKHSLSYHAQNKQIHVKVPPVTTMAAVKLGLPVDYKNNYDALVLLRMCTIDSVIAVIIATDAWKELVLRRIPKAIGRLHQKERIECILARTNGIDIKEHITMLNYIQNTLKKQ